MKLEAKGWPPRGSTKSIDKGLSQWKVTTENADEAVTLLALQRLFTAPEDMDDLDHVLMGHLMSERKIKPVTKEEFKELFDAAYARRNGGK